VNNIEIKKAVDRFRAKCPESYRDATDTELIVGILFGSGLFGSMAAKAIQRAQKAEELNKDLLAALKNLTHIQDGWQGTPNWKFDCLGVAKGLIHAAERVKV
jgi:hypothetical protein